MKNDPLAELCSSKAIHELSTHSRAFAVSEMVVPTPTGLACRDVRTNKMNNISLIVQ
jgi:hypothetical protein